MQTDNRNITDFFKYWTDDAIKTNLDTKRHNFSVLVQNVIKDFNLLDETLFRKKYNEKIDSRDWTYLGAKNELENASIRKIDYRPFDRRFIIYSKKSKGIL